jgi:hypothetical protein
VPRWPISPNDSTGAVYIHDLNVAPDGLLPTADDDSDGLPNGWEEQFGLNPALAILDDGPDGDPDHDGATNAQERAANTHPRGVRTSYFAEGVTNSFFQTRFALFNPASAPAIVWLRFLRDDGTTVTQAVKMPARTRRTVMAEGVSGLAGRSFSTLIEAGHFTEFSSNHAKQCRARHGQRSWDRSGVFFIPHVTSAESTPDSR